MLKISRQWTSDDIDILERLVQAEARESFWSYRCYVHKDLVRGWWQREVATHLQQFWEDLKAGKRPVLVLQSPPQHGKSSQAVDLISWVAGLNPNLKTIYASYGEELGVRANMDLQRLLDSERYAKVFSKTKLSDRNVVTLVSRYQRNSSLLEYVDALGSFRNTTVLGQITGMGLDLGVIDDPIKGRETAQSKLQRDKVWNWFTDDFFSRFSDSAGLLIIMTRWHIDDPVGRFLERFPDAKVLRYPALAEHDELHRKLNEPLFPQLKSAAFLAERRKLMTTASWEALYQQNPIAVGGGMFPVDRFVIAPLVPRQEIRKSVRYWDKAGTEDGGAYTCGVLTHRLFDGRVQVADVVRGQWSSWEREKRIKQTCLVDNSGGQRVETVIEQEPGSGGKESAEHTVAMLSGYKCSIDRVTGHKEVRAEPWASQVQAGNALLVPGNWVREFMDEHEVFPVGKYKDQVDAAAGAFLKVTLGASYDATAGVIA